ncbi:MAG: hypothetical protein IVW57_04445 [Ktedonobacterales bacterium]|nr:hypothetical protein [Ktedonobacterales bacterium]
MILPQIDDEHTPAPEPITVLAADVAGHGISALLVPHETLAAMAGRADLLTQAAWIVARALPAYHGERGRILAEHLGVLAANLHMLEQLAVCDAATLAAQLVAPTDAAHAKAGAMPAPTPPPDDLPAPRRVPGTRSPRRRTPSREHAPMSRPTSAGRGGHAA